MAALNPCWTDSAGAGPLAGYPTANWLLRGKIVHAGYPGASDHSLGLAIRTAVLEAGVTHVVCLQPFEELLPLPPYLATLDPAALLHNKPLGACTAAGQESDLRLLPISWQHFPVADRGTTDDDQLRGLLEECLARIATGGVLLIHCMGGHGRSGVVCSCLAAALLNLSAVDALELVQTAHDMREDAWAKGHQTPETTQQRVQVERLLASRGGCCKHSSRITGGANNTSFRLGEQGPVLKLYGAGAERLTDRPREQRLMRHLAVVAADGALCKRLVFVLPGEHGHVEEWIEGEAEEPTGPSPLAPRLTATLAPILTLTPTLTQASRCASAR